MPHVHLNIGSNLGNREDNIGRAVALLRQLACDISSIRVSTLHRSEPWGYESSNEFLNVGVSFDTDLSPHNLLEAVQGVQSAISSASHRDANGGYADRVIDIDIIAYADTEPKSGEQRLIRRSSATLTLPHPRALMRDFVIVPMREIDEPLYELLVKGSSESEMQL